VRIIVRQPHRGATPHVLASRDRECLLPLSLSRSPSESLSFPPSRRRHNGTRFLPSIVPVECCGMANCAGTKTGFYSRSAWRERIILFRRAISRTSARWPLRLGQWPLFGADLRACCTHVPPRESHRPIREFLSRELPSRCISNRAHSRIDAATLISARVYRRNGIF